MLAVRIFALVLSLFVIVATLLPFFEKDHWWIRIFDFPRIQIFGLGLLSLGLLAISWYDHWFEYVIALSVVSALVYQATAIFPYTPLAKKQVLTCKDPDGHPVFSLMVMNVFMNNRNAEEARQIIFNANPDILLAVETDHWWSDNLRILEKDYPHRVSVPLENTYGMLLFSKLKLVEPEVKFIYISDVPSIHTKVQLETGEFFKLFCVHPKPPAPGHSDSSTHRDAELVTIGKETRDIEEPVIVAGDLNDVAWSFTTNLFQRFSELLDPRVGRGMFNTFHAKYHLFRWPLDHIFHSDHFQLLEIKTLPYFGSDHFPIYVRLCFMPAKRHEQDEPEAEHEDVERAHDKMARAKTK